MPGESETVEVSYFAQANSRIATTAVCDVQGGPSYEAGAGEYFLPRHQPLLCNSCHLFYHVSDYFCHLIYRVFYPRLLSYMASYNLAGIVSLALQHG